MDKNCTILHVITADGVSLHLQPALLIYSELFTTSLCGQKGPKLREKARLQDKHDEDVDVCCLFPAQRSCLLMLCVLIFTNVNTHKHKHKHMSNSGLPAFQQLVFPPQQMSGNGNVNRTAAMEASR